jgi:predicted nucleotidyltransferase
MDTVLSPLANLCFGQIRGRVLGLLYGRPDESFYIRQVARQVEASVGAVQRELEKLAQVDLIVRSQVGNQVFYQVNQQHPVFSEMRSLVNKTVGVFHILRSALESLANQIVVAFVYGSMARQQEKAQSDIDLMIVGDVRLDDVFSCLFRIERVLGRPVNPTVYSADEFRSKLGSGNHFLNTVVEGKKVFLLGNEDELRKLGRGRMAEAGARGRKRN